MKADFVLQGDAQTTVYLLVPQNEDAERWLHANTSSASWQWFGKGLVVERRYIGALVEGAQAAGFVVRGEQRAQS